LQTNKQKTTKKNQARTDLLILMTSI